MKHKLSYELDREIQSELESLIHSCECELYDIALVRENEVLILRISIMASKGSTTLELCTKVSEIISPFLDVKDFIKDAYHLEVSSPGLERVLKIPRHFMLSVGTKVLVRTLDKNELEATILGADEEGVEFELEQSRVRIPYGELKKVKTIFEW